MTLATPSEAERAALEQRAVNTIRFLAADAVEKAKSGHPGMPMGMADVAFVLWTRFLRHDPFDPEWPDRDRFVLSAGHGSMLLYAMLHLSGYDLPLVELERFRQIGSRTPGHPEHGLTPGVEVTTGPLGQGFGNGVGLAIASKMLAARFAGESFQPATWRVFGIVSDGDLMEGISQEAASLAGHLGLGNLVYVYDDNHVSIEGNTALAYSDDVQLRFEALHWHVERADAHDRAAVERAIAAGVAERERPSLVIARSHIAYGAPKKQDTAAAHGEPLGAEELAGAKRALGWPEAPAFLIPEDVRALFAARADQLKREHDHWRNALGAWRKASPEPAALWDAHVDRRIPGDVLERLVAAAPKNAAATRAHGNVVLQEAARLVPSLVGGSADLEPSTKTRIQDSPSVERGHFEGRNFHFGVREHGMGAILNGLALSGAFVPYGASFLVFTDYCRPAIRLSALTRQRVIWVFTHDSVLLGEDGPTHQPIEHLGALRLIPNLLVVRPADGPETAGAWGLALERAHAPTLLVLTRQNLPAIERPLGFEPDMMRRGAYLLRDAAGADAITLIATGSEVSLAIAASETLAKRGGPPVRVVSMPAPTLFLGQNESWRAALLPPGGRRVSIEAAATAPWRAIVGERGLTIGIDTFGESAPLKDIAEHFGLTPDKVADRILAWEG